jgi:IS605 OrfB family transposase
VKDAYHSIKDLPRFVTFGGLRNQRLREKHKINQEEYRKRRNRWVYSRGDKSKQGNLNMRINVQEMVLRINLGTRGHYIYPKLYIPQKYLNTYGAFLTGTIAYTIGITRRDHNAGFDVHITIEQESRLIPTPRVLALDVNAGHTDFAVLDKTKGTIVTIGTIAHHETQHTTKGKRQRTIHQIVDLINNLATHYDAEVVTGKMNTSHVQGKSRQARRQIRQLPQYQFRQILGYKLPLRGTPVKERSEAYTSIGGKQLSGLIGLDTHKCAAILFALKVTNYPLFQALVKVLTQSSFNDGGGSPRKRTGSGIVRGLTALCQNGRVYARMKFWLTMMQVQEELRSQPCGDHSAIPGSWGLSFFESLKSTFMCHHVMIS